MKLQRFSLNAGSLGGIIQILRPLPSEKREGGDILVDPWGVLAPLREVPLFAQLIPVVDGEAFSHALHGFMRPLMESIGPAPEHQVLRIPNPFNQCSRAKGCIMYNERRCRPRSKKLPECWLPEGDGLAAQVAMSIVTLAWAEDRYVVVVAGPEFVVGG